MLSSETVFKIKRSIKYLSTIPHYTFMLPGDFRGIPYLRTATIINATAMGNVASSVKNMCDILGRL